MISNDPTPDSLKSADELAAELSFVDTIELVEENRRLRDELRLAQYNGGIFKMLAQHNLDAYANSEFELAKARQDTEAAERHNAVLEDAIDDLHADRARDKRLIETLTGVLRDVRRERDSAYGALAVESA